MILQGIFCLVVTLLVAYLLTPLVLFVLDYIAYILAKAFFVTGIASKLSQPSNKFTGDPNEKSKSRQDSTNKPQNINYPFKTIIKQYYLEGIPLRRKRGQATKCK